MPTLPAVVASSDPARQLGVDETGAAVSVEGDPNLKGTIVPTAAELPKPD